MSRALAWILAALSILISCALAYQEASLLASGPRPEDKSEITTVLLSEPDDEIDLIEEDAKSTQVGKSRRYFVEQLAKRLNLPMSSISMGTAVGEPSARVRITCTQEQRAEIDRVLDDVQFPLKLLNIVSVTLTDKKGSAIETNATGSETLGYPLGRDLIVFDSLKTFCKPAAQAILQSGIAHNERCRQADPNDPVLVANKYVLKRALSPDKASPDPSECSMLAEIEKKTAKNLPDRANQATHLIAMLGCTAGDASAVGSKLGVDEQAQYLRDQIHPDIIRSYLISDIYTRNNQPEKAKAALGELPTVNHDVAQSLVVDGISFLLTGIALLAYAFTQKPKLYQLPEAPISVACPYRYGWVKPHIIIFIAFIFAIGGFIAEAAILGAQAEETTALLVSYFDPMKRALLDNLDELMLLLPVILAATWLVNKGKFIDFVRLYLKTDQYSTKQLIKIGLQCFILTWAPAMMATLLSYWYHFPWQKPSTVSTELLIGSGSIPALAILFFGYAILAPILEEVAFRGILHPALRRNFSMWPSIIIGSAFFACIHFEFTPWWLLDKFLFAAVNAYALEKTGSIVPGIISHMTTNALVMVLMMAALS